MCSWCTDFMSYNHISVMIVEMIYCFSIQIYHILNLIHIYAIIKYETTIIMRRYR